MPRPKKPLCPVCTSPMTKFLVDGEETWKCTSVKAHDIAVHGNKGKGGRRDNNSPRGNDGKFR